MHFIHSILILWSHLIYGIFKKHFPRLVICCRAKKVWDNKIFPFLLSFHLILNTLNQNNVNLLVYIHPFPVKGIQDTLNPSSNALKMTGRLLHLFFLFKSKFRRKLDLNIPIVVVIIYSLVFIVHCDNKLQEKSSVVCINGDVVNGSCICHDGWHGDSCQFCSGKVR